MKRVSLKILLALVFLATFNCLFFLLDWKESGTTAWISYGFIHFAYLMLLASPLLCRKYRRMASLSGSVYSVSGLYFLAELVVGLILILALKKASVKAVLVIHILLTAAYFCILLTVLLSNMKTAGSESDKNSEVSFLRDKAHRVRVLMNACDDRQNAALLEKVYDALHASPVMTEHETGKEDRALSAYIDQLETACKTGDAQGVRQVSDRIISTLSERNNR